MAFMMTQKEIAQIIKSSQSHLSNILRGRRIATPILINKLFDAHRRGLIPFEEIKPFLNVSTKAAKLAILTSLIDENNFDKSLSLAIDKIVNELERGPNDQN